MITTCQDCNKRYLGCHDRCKTYQDYKQSIKRPSRESDYEYNEYLKIARKRMKRTGGIRRTIPCKI